MMTDSMDKIKILLIGPLPPPLGGATVLFELLTKELELMGELLNLL